MRTLLRAIVRNLLLSDALFQGLNEVHARVATRHFGNLQVALGEFPRRTERLTVGHTSATTPNRAQYAPPVAVGSAGTPLLVLLQRDKSMC